MVAMDVLSNSFRFADRCIIVAAQVVGIAAIGHSLLAEATSMGEICAGLGTAGVAVQALRANVARRLGIQMMLHLVYATELVEGRREHLRRGTWEEHDHIFGDLMTRVDPRAWCGPRDLWHVMQRALSFPVLALMYCYKWRCYCAVPRVDILVAGIPCTDWSKIGRREGETGSTMPVLAAFVRELLETKPLLAIVENVPQFPIDVLRPYIASYYDIIVFPITSPSDASFGLVERKRMYFVCVNRNSVEIHYDMILLFHEICAHNVQADNSAPRHALVADMGEVMEELTSACAARGVDPSDLQRVGPEAALLHHRELAGLHYMEQVHWRRFGYAPALDADLCLFMGDNPWWRLTWSKLGRKIPTFRLNNGWYWFSRARRFLTSREKLCAMGFPMYPELAEAMGIPVPPFDPMGAAQSVGNCMHVGNIYQITLCALVCTRLRQARSSA